MLFPPGPMGRMTFPEKLRPLEKIPGTMMVALICMGGGGRQGEVGSGWGRRGGGQKGVAPAWHVLL